MARVEKYLVVLFLITLAGCALPKQRDMTRQEWIDATTRTYDANEDEVVAASKRIFLLADGNDFKFDYTDTGIAATRQWSIYLVLGASFGSDAWRIDTSKVGSQTRTRVLVSSQAAPVMPLPTAKGDYSASSLPGQGSSISGTATYSLFFSRMDWMLGKIKDWPTCNESNKRIEKNIEWGINDPLCNSFNVDDLMPKEKDRIIPYVTGLTEEEKSRFILAIAAATKPVPNETSYAKIDDLNKFPKTENQQQIVDAYKKYLENEGVKVFVLSNNGGWAYKFKNKESQSLEDLIKETIEQCESLNKHSRCWPYAVNNTITWNSDLSLSNKFGGVGVKLKVEDGFFVIQSLIENSPASKSGIKEGDRIIKISGMPIKGLTMKDVVEKIQGSQGTTVEFTIDRKDDPAQIVISINREVLSYN